MIANQDPSAGAIVPGWLRIARRERGVHEIPGAENSARIRVYQSSTRLPQDLLRDETPWCSCFVNWCFEQDGVEGTKSARALSWLDWGVPIAVPVLGCLCVYSRKVIGHPPGRFGHVNFFERLEGNQVIGTGGNQHNAVSTAPRPLVDLLCYRMPLVTRRTTRPPRRAA